MRPVFFEKVWGGDKLRQLKRDSAPAGGPLGESWEVADLLEGASVVDGGPHDGRSLRDLVLEHGEDLTGDRPVDGRFPLLVKLIDAADDLSVQVHPGPQDVARHEGAASKEEAWVIVGADDGGRVLHGFVEGMTADRFRASVDDGTAGESLREVAVTPGDVVHVQPGTFHAIGRGVFLLEIQQPSDTTFRVWDWGRVGLDGKPRALHVEQALDVARYAEQPPALTTPTPLGGPAGGEHELLVDAGSFRIERVRLADGARASFAADEATPLVLVPTRGALRVDAGGQADVGTLASCVVAAVHSRVELEARGELELIVAGVGGAALLSS
jgi:mannose-6-phosphate isomerase